MTHNTKYCAMLLLFTVLLSAISCRPQKCASLDAGDVKVSKKKKPNMGLFSKKEMRQRKWK